MGMSPGETRNRGLGARASGGGDAVPPSPRKAPQPCPCVGGGGEEAVEVGAGGVEAARTGGVRPASPIWVRVCVCVGIRGRSGGLRSMGRSCAPC